MRNKTKDKTFYNIYKDSKNQNDKKLEISLDKMYISEVLALLSHRVFLKDKVRKIFLPLTSKPQKMNFV